MTENYDHILILNALQFAEDGDVIRISNPHNLSIDELIWFRDKIQELFETAGKDVKIIFKESED